VSKIEWTGETWNPIAGCSIVSPGCTNCYAMRMAARLEAMAHAAAGKRNDATEPLGALSHYLYLTQPSKAGPVWTGKVALAPDDTLLKPLRRKKPTTYFVNSMSDLFHEQVPDEWIDRVFAVMALTPRHTYQVLTKRSARMLAYLSGKGIQERLEQEMLNWIAYLPKPWDYTTSNGEHLPRRQITCHDPVVSWPLPNVWSGVSCEDQRRADERIPDLLATPAAVRFVSAEPLLGAIDFGRWLGGADAAEGQRREIIPTCDCGNIRDRPDGPHLAHRGEDATSGERHGRLLADQSNDLGTSSARTGAPVGMEAFQRPYTGWTDDQPQGRVEEKQPTEQLGVRDEFGTGDSRSRRIGQMRPAGGMEQQCEANDGGGAHHPQSTRSGRITEIHRGGLRSERQNDFQDRTRPSLDWIICGGESGTGARPMHPDWARSIRDQCQAAGVPFFFKQWGSWGVTYDRDKEDPDWRRCDTAANNTPRGQWLNIAGGRGFHGERVVRVNPMNKARPAGRLLDGRTWDEMPDTARGEVAA